MIRIAVASEFDTRRKELKNITDKEEREEEEVVIKTQEDKIHNENDFKEQLWLDKLKEKNKENK